MIQESLHLLSPCYLHCRRKRIKNTRYNDVFERQDFSSLYATDMSSLRNMQLSLHYTKTTMHDKKKHTQLSAHLFTIECTELAVAMLTKNCTNTRLLGACNIFALNNTSSKLIQGQSFTLCTRGIPMQHLATDFRQLLNWPGNTSPKGACGQATLHAVQHCCLIISRAVLFFVIDISNFQWSLIGLWKKAFSSCCRHKQCQMLCYLEQTYMKWFEQ